jgi:hypothetical protein
MRIEFEIEKNGVIFKDAIEIDDNHTLTETEIDKIKKQRYVAWKDAVAPECLED